MEPGTKIAIISKSGEAVTHVAPSEKETSDKDVLQPPPPAVKENGEMQKPKVEATAAKEKPKPSPPSPSKVAATEPVLPPKERERRVGFMDISSLSTI